MNKIHYKKFAHVYCPTCDLPFGLLPGIYLKYATVGGTFYCPGGHLLFLEHAEPGGEAGPGVAVATGSTLPDMPIHAPELSRRDILDAVAANPGHNSMDVARMLGTSQQRVASAISWQAKA